MEEEKVEVPAKFKDLVEKIEAMSVLDLHELVKLLEKRFGVSAAAVAVAGAAAPAAARGAVAVRYGHCGVLRGRAGGRPGRAHSAPGDGAAGGLRYWRLARGRRGVRSLHWFGGHRPGDRP